LPMQIRCLRIVISAKYCKHLESAKGEQQPAFKSSSGRENFDKKKLKLKLKIN
jgi:hypothetical protein